MSFTCGIRISCARGRCMYTACGNPEHKEYRGMDPWEAMQKHRADVHPDREVGSPDD